MRVIILIFVLVLFPVMTDLLSLTLYWHYTERFTMLYHDTEFKVMLGPVSLEELRAVCEKGLLLLAITIPEMEVDMALLLLNSCLLFVNLILIKLYFKFCIIL